MSFCHNCGYQLPPNSNACPRCGAKANLNPTMPLPPPPVPSARPAAAPKKSNTALIIILLVIITLVLAGAGIFAYLYFSDKNSKPKAIEPLTEEVEEVEVEDTYVAVPVDLTPYEQAFEKAKNGEYLTDYDLYGLSKDELRRLRNLPFALHGRYFDSQDLASYFNQFHWYSPYRYDVPLNDMSAAERANISLIQKHE